MEQKTNNEAIVDQEEEKRPNEAGQLAISGHIKIFDPNSGEVIVDKRNAIHYENISQSIACLLYTSPSPRDVEESRMPGSA